MTEKITTTWYKVSLKEPQPVPVEIDSSTEFNVIINGFEQPKSESDTWIRPTPYSALMCLVFRLHHHVYMKDLELKVAEIDLAKARRLLEQYDPQAIARSREDEHARSIIRVRVPLTDPPREGALQLLEQRDQDPALERAVHEVG